MKNKTSSQTAKLFAHILRKVSLTGGLLKLVPIPVGILTAKLMADIVSGAADGNIHAVLTGGILLIGITAGSKLFGAVSSIFRQNAVSKAQHKCKLLLYERFLSGPMSELYQSEHGTATEMLNDDFNTVIGRSLNTYPGFLSGLITAAAYFFYLAVQNILPAVTLLAISVLQVVPPLIVKRFMQQNFDACRKIEAELTDFIFEAYNGFAEIKMYGLKNWWLSRLAALHKRYLKIGIRTEATAKGEDALNNLVQNILTYGIYGIFGLFIMKSLLSLDTGIEAIALSGGFFSAVKGFFDAIPAFAVAKTAENRMEKQIFDRAEGEAPTENSRMEGNDVSLTFDSKKIFEHAAFKIHTDSVSVVRGPNGIGKSTLLKMVVGLLVPQEGSVMLNGIETHRLAENVFPHQVFYLPQDDPVFHITPLELYRAVLPGNTGTAVQFAHAFALTDALLENPIDTLSGGERKKVFLSLAFAVKPRLLLLDEPTNSLDAQSCRHLCRLLKERDGGAVIITHDSVFDGVAEHNYTMNEGGEIYESNKQA